MEIGLTQAQRKATVNILNTLLADEYVLYTKTRNYHWNVVGPQFNELHKFFESQYEELDEIVDEVAERARALGGRSAGTLTEFLKFTQLKEQVDTPSVAAEMISSLLADHEMIIRRTRMDLETCAEKQHDMGTSDFLTGKMEQHEKMAWMLRSFLS